jgi:hypothetical protein
MSRTIWRIKRHGSIGSRLLIYGFIAFFIFLLLLAALTGPPQYRFNDTLGLAIISSVFFAVYYVILRLLPSTVEVRFTEDGLVVRGRRGFTVPRDVVVSNNVVCIRKSSAGLRLHVTHGLVEYSFPLSQRQYDELINALSTYWGWEPPECPSVKVEVGPATSTTPVTPEASAPLTMPGGVLWRWGTGKYNVMYYIGLGGTVFNLFYLAIGLLLVVGVIAWLLHWNGFLSDLIVVVIVIAIVSVIGIRMLRVLRWSMYSDVREIVLTSDGFTITDKSGNTFFIPRDEALDSICVGGTALVPSLGNAPPTGSNIEYILLINYNGVTYRVPMLRGEFNRLQEVLSRAWGRSIRGC